MFQPSGPYSSKRHAFSYKITRCQRAAAKELSCRAQATTESHATFILDVLALHHSVDVRMSYADKLSYVLKGIDNDVFKMFIFEVCPVVNESSRERRRFQNARSRRIAQHIVRLPYTTATSSFEDAH